MVDSFSQTAENVSAHGIGEQHPSYGGTHHLPLQQAAFWVMRISSSFRLDIWVVDHITFIVHDNPVKSTWTTVNSVRNHISSNEAHSLC